MQIVKLQGGARAGLALTVAAALLSSCSSTAAQPASRPSAAGGGKVPLVVYSAQGYDSAVTKAFTAATKIPVKLVDDSTGPLLTKIAAERSNPQWDVLWVDGDTAFATLDRQHQLLPYAPPGALTKVGHTLVPTDHSYLPVSITVVPALIYNAAQGSPVPTSYQSLLGPAYRDKVGMNDPSQSGPTFPLIASLMNQLGGRRNGVKAGEAFLTRLKANGLHVNPTNGDTLHALETGQITYGLVQSSAAIGEQINATKTASFNPKVVFLPTSTLVPGVIGIDKAASAQAQSEAKKFEQFVLSPAGQKAMQSGDPTGDSLYWPIVPGVSPLAGMPALPAHPGRINPYFWGPLEGSVNTFFDSTIK